MYEDILQQLVSLNSYTQNISGVYAVSKVFARCLEELGLDVDWTFNSIDEHESAPLLVAEAGPGLSKYITLVCHSDTVFKQGKSNFDFKVEGSRAYGPGVVDNKGGMLVILNGLVKYLSLKKPEKRIGIRVVCSPNEETGSNGFIEKFNELAKSSDIILGFEPAYQDGHIINGRKGNRWYDVKVKGKRAHSGRDHRKGVNACSELALTLAEVQAYTDYEKDVTVNIGKIEGGTNHNVVSDHALAQLELRYPCHDSAQLLTEKVEKTLEKSFVKNDLGDLQSETEYQVVDDCPPFSPNEKSQNFLKFYINQIERIEGKKISAVQVGGAADVNHFSSPDKVIIDGLGPVGGGMHTRQEFIELPSIETRGDALCELLKYIEENYYD